ncbi:Oxysterol-binding protein-domain-containing protein [Mycena capillaripes]|nr:Oxysterol-binding protein-domain-containing protein [Mycena capillaripes]
MIDTDEEDEFFDAIEANTIPNLVVHEALKSPTHSELALPQTVNVEPYAGYQNLRQELLLSDARPSTSLWSVLKHSIGKDLTKISFPVFFNEPTSMLQRMAEDMEFSECLDVAAKERDAHRRIAFVAAFAMSNYSSTIGRIAKPFNPMLSETFEYVRIDKEYRYLSEQVSHHPPISACMAESPYWQYYGEFMGKSFEIRPTGVAHAELLLPAEFAPSYPKASGPFEGKVREHYSWKKVTTNVSGFILGSPTIDHYGDMVITNHRTKDTCILTFKPRGWRGKDAYEISGRVMDANGRVSYEISGRWNSQLIARQIGAGSTPLNPDLRVSSLNSPSATPEYILLWRNSEKPEGSPFNLTPFAISLNDCPKDTLKPYLCPTDCRLRPDQRAFEMGKYESANTLKNDQEEKQRTTRKLREQGELPPHKPRWFTAETDGDTGERVWTPSRLDDGAMEYWAERERVWKQGGNQQWTDVAPIFIEEPDFIR